MNSNLRQFLFHGELSDAPGRDESWDEYVQYLGSNRWKFIVNSTDFAGVNTVPTAIEMMSTKSIVNWVLERDAEIEVEAKDSIEDDDSIPLKELGPRGDRLREIAASEGASYCVTCLDGWLSGSWPPNKKQSTVRLLEVKRLTRRGVWLGIYHTVYDVETNLGPAYMYPPNDAHMARLVLKTEGSMSPGRTVKVPRAFFGEGIAELKLTTVGAD